MLRRLFAGLFGSREGSILSAILAVTLVAAAVIVPYAYSTSREALLTDAEINMASVAQDAAQSANLLFESAWSLAERIVEARLDEVDTDAVQRLFFALASVSA